MRLFRAILVVFLALLFVYSTNRCLIAAAFPDEVETCCESESAPDESTRGLPCKGSDCTPCVTLESGVNVAALGPLVLAAPVWIEDQNIARLMRLMEKTASEILSPPPDPAAIPSPPWCDVMMKALPVRGPSLVA